MNIRNVIGLRDVIYWLVVIILGVYGVNARNRTIELQQNKQVIHNTAKTIQQFFVTQNYPIPSEIKEGLSTIVAGTAPGQTQMIP